MTKKKKTRLRSLPADDPIFRQGWRVIPCDGPVGGTGRLSDRQIEEIFEAGRRNGWGRPDETPDETPEELPTAKVVPFPQRDGDPEDES